MKKLTALTASLAFSAAAFGADIGVVDMQQVFHSSKHMKKVNKKLEDRFADDKKKIMGMGKVLQSDMEKYRKDKSVMSKSKLTELRKKITSEEKTFRQKQASFQKELFDAQNSAMSTFVESAKAAVAKVAEEKHLDLVLPKNIVLYSGKRSSDLTDAVLNELDK